VWCRIQAAASVGVYLSYGWYPKRWAKLLTDHITLSIVTQRKKFTNTEFHHVSPQRRHGTEIGIKKDKVNTSGQKNL
jgi:hypothetical protein